MNKMLVEVCEGMEKIKEGMDEFCKMGKANRNKTPLNKLT